MTLKRILFILFIFIFLYSKCEEPLTEEENIATVNIDENGVESQHCVDNGSQECIDRTETQIPNDDEEIENHGEEEFENHEEENHEEEFENHEEDNQEEFENHEEEEEEEEVNENNDEEVTENSEEGEIPEEELNPEDIYYDPELKAMQPEPETFTVIFKNWSKERVTLWWDDDKDGISQGEMDTEGEIQINTFEGHKFFFTPSDNPTKRLYSVVATKYEDLINLYSEEEMKKHTEEFEKNRKEFLKTYHETTGRTWKNYYPRGPVIHPIYNAEYIGQKFYVTTSESYTYNNNTDDTNNQPHPITFELEVLCTSPKVIRVNNVLTDFECEHIIEAGHKIGLKRSTVSEKALIDETRTSVTAWVDRSYSKVLDRLFRRIAHIVNISESYLWLTKSAESLQLVYYNTTQEYRSHHDYGVDRPNNRFLTFLMYLNNPEEGGETGFPLADDVCKNGQEEFKLHPGKGNAVFFYSLFEDGNVDDKSLHAALPVIKGEKWMTNLWIWDPSFT